ncbi:MAG: DUF58 domain-containing protein [Rhodobacterales bacterium]|nr:MAG: DUF58 domain-containing protein [Rhodobacterales bacterium]
MSGAADLRARAEGLAAPLPALLAGAERLASTVQTGLHGRRRAGAGEAFWQFRPAEPRDGMRGIDWRRSARGDDLFAREREWQVAQVVQVWVDPGPGMGFASGDVTKAQRAQELALAVAILAARGGERIGPLDPTPPRGGETQVTRLATRLVDGVSLDPVHVRPHGRLALLGDFLGDLAPVEAVLTEAAARGVKGVLCQVLDPDEVQFPYKGRTIFEDMTGTPQHETLKADGLRDRYLERLAQRQADLRRLAERTGWQVLTHRTDTPAAEALLWMMRALGPEGASC